MSHRRRTRCWVLFSPMNAYFTGVPSQRTRRRIQSVDETHRLIPKRGCMAGRGRPGLSNSEKRKLWNRWKRGESLSEIARALAKNPGSIHGVLRSKGGIAPDARKRAGKALSIEQREEILRHVAAGFGVRYIAKAVHRSPRQRSVEN